MTSAKSASLAPSQGVGRVSAGEIRRLVWPQFLMMCFQFLVGLTDVWVAGQIHRDVQAVLGVITQCQFVLLIVGTAAASASATAMSQALGAGLPDRARRYAGLVLKIGLLFSFAALFFALAFKAYILRLLQVPEEILPLAEDFWRVFLIALPAHYLLALTGAVFRAYKSVRIPLLTAGMAFVINAFADFGLGLGLWGMPNLGARGIAYATVASISSMALLNLWVLARRGVIRKSSFAPWAWGKKALPPLIRVAAPAGAMQVSWQLGVLALFGVTASLPNDNVNALAGMSAGMRVESMLFLPAVAFSMTASTLVGHCLGAGNAKEAKSVGWRLILSGVGSMSLAAACLWPFLKDVTAFISPDVGAQAHALAYLRYNLLATPFSVASMCLGGIMVGAGAAVYSFSVFGLAIWGVRLPLAWVFGHLVWETSEGVFMGMLVSQAFQACVMLYIFQTRNWARFAMIKRRRA